MKVNDILPTNLAIIKVVLILESPFKDEVIHNHPLAGSSGQSVTEYIRQRVSINSPIKNFSCPLGCELKNKTNSELGIMNFSLYPLDPDVYCQLSAIRPNAHRNLIEAFRIIRENPASSSRRTNTKVIGKYVEKVECYLKSRFQDRINNIYSANNQVIFVPCGEVARSFFIKSGYTINTQLNDIPHPSRNQWDNFINPAFNLVLSTL